MIVKTNSHLHSFWIPWHNTFSSFLISFGLIFYSSILLFSTTLFSFHSIRWRLYKLRKEMDFIGKFNISLHWFAWCHKWLDAMRCHVLSSMPHICIWSHRVIDARARSVCIVCTMYVQWDEVKRIMVNGNGPQLTKVHAYSHIHIYCYGSRDYHCECKMEIILFVVISEKWIY